MGWILWGGLAGRETHHWRTHAEPNGPGVGLFGLLTNSFDGIMPQKLFVRTVFVIELFFLTY